MFKIGKSTETESKLLVARGWRKGKCGVIATGYKVSFGSDENILELGNYQWFAEYTKNG